MSYAETKKKRKTEDVNGRALFVENSTGDWPNLCSALDSYLDVDRFRSVLSIQLYCKRGRLTMRIQDREDELQCFVECETFEEVWPAIEHALGSDSTDWSRQKPAGRQ